MAIELIVIAFLLLLAAVAFFMSEERSVVHTPELCEAEGCDCGCAFCLYSDQHIPGGSR